MVILRSLSDRRIFRKFSFDSHSNASDIFLYASSLEDLLPLLVAPEAAIIIGNYAW